MSGFFWVIILTMITEDRGEIRICRLCTNKKLLVIAVCLLYQLGEHLGSFRLTQSNLKRSSGLGKYVPEATSPNLVLHLFGFFTLIPTH